MRAEASSSGGIRPPEAPIQRHIARAVAHLLLLGAPVLAAPSSAAPDGAPARILTLGSWRTHDPREPAAGAEAWTAADVAGLLALYPTAYMDLGYRDGHPPGNRYWIEKGRQVDEAQRLAAEQGLDVTGRFCVTERPDMLAKLIREGSCEPSQGGGGCDWEGAMDGTYGEAERIVKHAGVATGGTDRDLEDARAQWQAAGWRHRLLVLRPGGADEESRRIRDNAASTLSVDRVWTQPPRSGDRYEIRGSFDPGWVKRVPRARHEATVSELWASRRNVCGSLASPTRCRPPAEPLDPFHPANRRSWPDWLDRTAIAALATPSAVPALYGPVFDAASRSVRAGPSWTDPYFSASSVVMDVADSAYREWRVRYLMYKLAQYGLEPGEPACIVLTYKPGWYTYYDEERQGPSGDVCSVPGSQLWTGPAHVCADGSAPGGPLVAGLYGPGQFERAINSYIREVIARLTERGWSGVRIIVNERPTFTRAKWAILDEDVRRHPAVIGEWEAPIDPPLAELSRRPRAGAPPTTPAPNAGSPDAGSTPPGSSARGGDASGPGPAGARPGPGAPAPEAPAPRGQFRRSGPGGSGGTIEPPSAR